MVATLLEGWVGEGGLIIKSGLQKISFLTHYTTDTQAKVFTLAQL